MGVGLLRPELAGTNIAALQQDGTLELATWAMSSVWLFTLNILVVNGARNRRQGYVHGLREVGWLSLPALALLVVGAIYEAVEIIHLVPLLLS